MKQRAAFGSGATIVMGALSGYPPKPPTRSLIADSCTASALASANTVIGAPLALPTRTRYNTSGLERPPLWPVLACPPMAGFEVSTEVSVPNRVSASSFQSRERRRNISPAALSKLPFPTTITDRSVRGEIGGQGGRVLSKHAHVVPVESTTDHFIETQCRHRIVTEDIDRI